MRAARPAPDGAVRPASDGAAAPPNVVGYLLDEAREALAAAGWPEVATVDARAPRRALVGPMRVIRQRRTASGIELVVCGEQTEDART